MIEVTVSRRVLMWSGATLLLVAFFIIGVAVTPRVQGRPILLLPRNRALFGYLERVNNWHERLVQEADVLTNVMPEEVSSEDRPAETDLPAFATPVPRAPALYDRWNRVRAVLDRLDALHREVEATAPPRGMEALHRLVTQAVQRHISWAEAVADYLAAPTETAANRVETERRAAEGARQVLGEMLTRQRLMLGAPDAQR